MNENITMIHQHPLGKGWIHWVFSMVMEGIVHYNELRKEIAILHLSEKDKRNQDEYGD